MIHKLENPDRIAELAPADTLKRIGLAEGKVFCDIGAGTGVFTLPAVQMSGSAVYAVDISGQMREVLHGKDGGNRIQIVDSIRAVPDDCCDIALLCAVMHELDNIPDMASQISRILKEQGVLAVIEFHKCPTTMGPPMEMRLSEDDVASALKNSFSLAERFDLGENYYCLLFKKG